MQTDETLDGKVDGNARRGGDSSVDAAPNGRHSYVDTDADAIGIPSINAIQRHTDGVVS